MRQTKNFNFIGHMSGEPQDDKELIVVDNFTASSQVERIYLTWDRYGPYRNEMSILS
jgi:uncharacterized protein YijF (DUF1287 family)